MHEFFAELDHALAELPGPSREGIYRSMLIRLYEAAVAVLDGAQGSGAWQYVNPQDLDHLREIIYSKQSYGIHE